MSGGELSILLYVLLVILYKVETQKKNILNKVFYERLFLLNLYRPRRLLQVMTILSSGKANGG